MTRKERADKKQVLKEFEKELADQTKPRTLQQLIIKIYQDFEELCFNLTKADETISIETLTGKSTYDFYRYKQLLQQHISRKRGR